MTKNTRDKVNNPSRVRVGILTIPAYPGLDRPAPSHISEIIRDDHPRDPEYPMFEELAGEDLLIVDDLRSHREGVERLRKEDEDKSRLLLAGMLRKEETFSRRELVDFARKLEIEVVADDEGGGTARTRKLKELEKAKEQRDAVERACHLESEVKRPSRKSSKKPRSSGPRGDPSYDNLELDEDQDTSRQELAIEYDELKRKETRTSKVLPLNKTDAATFVTRPLTRSSRKGEDNTKPVRLAIVSARVDREIKPLPKRAKLVPIDNSPRVGSRIQLTPPRKRFLESLAERPIFYHPNGKVRKNLKAHERKLFLEEDEWTASVTPFSVKCKACGFNSGLDLRSSPGYDTSLWIRHRTRCRPMYAAWLKKNGERNDAFESTIET